MNTINDDTADAADRAPERLKYSGMTSATTNDGTAATDNALPGTSPTGKEKVDVADILDSEGGDALSQLQPGSHSADD